MLFRSKPESQDICFVAGRSYADVVEEQRGAASLRPGRIVDRDGNVLGAHDGVHRFTVGQRRGIGGGAGEPRYVTSIDAVSGDVTVGTRADLAVAGFVGLLAERYGFRSGFVIPALLCIAGCVFLWERLRDTPSSLGLPPIDRFRDDYEHDAEGRIISDEPETLRQILFQRVLRSRAVWLVSLFNFFVYWVRSGAFDFATKFLVEQKGIPLRTGGVVTSAFELLGIPGSLLAGLLVDRYLRGQHARVSCVAMLLTAGALVAFYYIPANQPWLDGAAMGLLGFAIYEIGRAHV